MEKGNEVDYRDEVSADGKKLTMHLIPFNRHSTLFNSEVAASSAKSAFESRTEDRENFKHTAESRPLLASTCVNAKSCICSEKEQRIRVFETPRRPPICSEDCQILRHASHNARFFARFLMGAFQTIEIHHNYFFNDYIKRKIQVNARNRPKGELDPSHMVR